MLSMGHTAFTKIKYLKRFIDQVNRVSVNTLYWQISGSRIGIGREVVLLHPYMLYSVNLTLKIKKYMNEMCGYTTLLRLPCAFLQMNSNQVKNCFYFLS